MDPSHKVGRLAKLAVVVTGASLMLTGCADVVLGQIFGSSGAGSTKTESQSPDPDQNPTETETPQPGEGGVVVGEQPAPGVESDPESNAEPEPDSGSEPGESAPPKKDPAGTKTPGSQGGSPEQCLLGTWQINNQDFEQMMVDLLAGNPDVPAGMNMSFKVTGGSFFRFDDKGTFFSWREDYKFTMDGGGQEVTFISNSSEMGDYGVVLDFGGISNTHFTDFLWVAESIVVATDEVMEVAGIAQVVDRGGSGVQMELFGVYDGEVPRVGGRESVEGSVPFTCVGDTLTVTAEIDTEISMTRVAAKK